MPDACVKFIEDDLCSQKCLVPYHLLEGSGIRPGDVVSIHHGPCTYLCYIFILPPIKNEQNISISNAVSIKEDFNSQLRQIKGHHLTFPEAFNVEKLITFENLTVEMVFNKKYFDLNLNHYQNIIRCLLRNIFFCKGASVKCSSLEIAKMFSIVEIKIIETHLPRHVCGKISRATNLSISKFLYPEEVNATRGIEKISEMTSIYNTEKLWCYINSDKMIIITGPSGCGKSVLVKKFCLDFNCTFIMIDCLKKSDLTAEKCNEYFLHLTQCSTNNMSMLVIDQIDTFTQASFKVKLSPVYFLIQLIQRLKTSNVCVVATAVRKDLVHPAIMKFFKEVTIGVLSVNQRKKILNDILMSPGQIDLDKLARSLQSFVTSDIVQLCEKVVRSKEQHLSGESSINTLTNQDFEDALFNFTPSLLRSSAWNMKVKPVHWNEIGGMNRIKEKLQMCVEKPLLHPDVFEDIGLHCPNGVLLFGPPGCCKTTLARGLATECKANFFAANPSQIYSAYVGESEKNICELFYQARLSPPSIIFLDELDSLVGSRNVNTKEQGVAEKVLSTLLNEMDGASIKTNVQGHYDLNLTSEETVDEEKSRSNQVIVVAATNRPDRIDSALLRPGRFDVILYVPPPNYQERISILETVSKGMPLADIDFNKIAEKTEYFTGADLKNLANMAGMNAFRENKINSEYITQDHFIQALQHTKPSITKDQISLYEQLSIKYGLVASDE